MLVSKNQRKTIYIFVLVVTIFLFFQTGLATTTEATQSNKHLVIVLVPQFSFDDVEPFVSHLPEKIQRDLQFAAMSMRTAGGMNVQNNLLTLSTGERSVGVTEWNAYHGEEEIQGQQVKELYAQWSGRRSNASILHPAIFQLQENWLKSGLSIDNLGWLGQQLEKQEIHASSFGNSDVLDEKQRIAATLIMNQWGEAKGLIDDQILSTDRYFPTGRKTNRTQLSTEIRSVWEKEKDSLVIVELGDLQRIYSQQPKMDANYADKVKEVWFNDWAAWMEELVDTSRQMNLSISMWTISPMVSQEAKQQGKMLAPFFSWSTDQSNGLLLSTTTKQAGIVANLDFLPSIIHYFQLEQPDYLPGKAIQPSNATTQFDIGEEGLEIRPWLDFLDYLFLIYEARRDVITTYIVIVICLLLLTTGYWWLDRTRTEATKGIRITIGGILFSPLYFLWLTPLIRWLSEWQWISILLLLSILTSWLLTFLCTEDSLYLAVIGLANTFAILLDLWQGSARMMRSFLGYDPIIGARFYGLGNEYAGILLGSSLLGVIALYVWLSRQKVFSGTYEQRNKRLFLGLTSIFYAFIVFMIAAPAYGTNVGATIASFFTYGIAIVTLFSLGWNLKWILSGCVGFALLLAGFVYLHMNVEHTHVGAALELIFSGDIHSFMGIVKRKWEMNMKLIRVSLWGKLFVTSLLVLVIIMFRLKKINSPAFSQDVWFQGFRIIIVGSLLILLVNDSGIVAAATMMIYVTFPFIYLRFSEKQ